MLKIRDSKEFSKEIESLVANKNLTYLESAIHYLTKNGIDLDNARIKRLLTPKILKKIWEEACDTNMFGFGHGKKRNRRPRK
jgi:non-canonical (house-cleaning) NTP pyrophosphatase